MKKNNHKKLNRRQGSPFTGIVNTLAEGILFSFLSNRASLLDSLSDWVSAVTFNNLANTSCHQEGIIATNTKAASFLNNN